jgi:hypothetical protein
MTDDEESEAEAAALWVVFTQAVVEHRTSGRDLRALVMNWPSLSHESREMLDEVLVAVSGANVQELLTLVQELHGDDGSE